MPLLTWSNVRKRRRELHEFFANSRHKDNGEFPACWIRARQPLHSGGQIGNRMINSGLKTKFRLRHYAQAVSLGRGGKRNYALFGGRSSERIIRDQDIAVDIEVIT